MGPLCSLSIYRVKRLLALPPGILEQMDLGGQEGSGPHTRSCHQLPTCDLGSGSPWLLQAHYFLHTYCVPGTAAVLYHSQSQGFFPIVWKGGGITTSPKRRLSWPCALWAEQGLTDPALVLLTPTPTTNWGSGVKLSLFPDPQRLFYSQGSGCIPPRATV